MKTFHFDQMNRFNQFNGRIFNNPYATRLADWFTGLIPYMPYQLNQFKNSMYQFKPVKLVYRFNVYIIKPVPVVNRYFIT